MAQKNISLMLSEANAKFAIDLYRRQTASAADNIFMSPLSISLALAMTYLGARTKTKDQIGSTMHFSELDESDLHNAFNEIRLALISADQQYKLHVANRLYGEKSFTFLAGFLDATDKFYGAKLEPVDFGGDSSGATNLINEWVANNTAQMIPELLPPGSLNSLTRLVLINAVYFKGDWLRKFDPADTKEDNFHVSSTETIRVQLMHLPKAKWQYGVNHDLDCQALELPYIGKRLSMFVILPTTPDKLASLESALTADTVFNIHERFHMREQDVIVWLPKFKLDLQLSLTEVLSTMGMTDMFSQESADFSGIDGAKQLFVSKVLHQAVIDVNEEGTEAAAATAVVMMLRCAPMHRDPFEFRADRPFLFFIRDNLTRSIIFIGRLVKPALQ